MSKLKDVYENLTEYVDVINSRRREMEENDDLTEDCIDAVCTTLGMIEEELTMILEGKVV